MAQHNNSLPAYRTEIGVIDKLFGFGFLPFGFDMRAIKYQASIPKTPLILYSCRLGTKDNSWGEWAWEIHFRFFTWEVMLSQLTKKGLEKMEYDWFWDGLENL